MRRSAARLQVPDHFGDFTFCRSRVARRESARQGAARQLQIVFSNLLLNAAQAMEGEGRIEVTISHGDGRCSVRVRDHGRGVPADVRPKIFEPFFTTKHRGTGLGLATARQIVDLRHGRIAVSNVEGGGAEVTVTLPLSFTQPVISH
jgi:signal transduction histidine kinase